MIGTENIDDTWFSRMSFDVYSEPFTHDGLGLTAYKNYIRNGSGDYDGYIILIKRTRQLIEIRSSKALIELIFDLWLIKERQE